MDIAYVAHSARCALLLDEAGVCVWFVLKDADEDALPMLQRCVGAQFVASLDPETKGCLGHAPEIGKRVLLARIDDGRVSLIRFGPLVLFERVDTPSSDVGPEAITSGISMAAPAAVHPAVPPDPPSDPTLEWQPGRAQREDFDDLVTNVDFDARQESVASHARPSTHLVERAAPALHATRGLLAPFAAAAEERRLAVRAGLVRAVAAPAVPQQRLVRRRTSSG